MSRRFDIYLNGTDGVKHLAINMLCAWRALMPACGRFGLATVEFIASMGVVFLVIIMPFFLWLAPLVAIFTAHRTLSNAEICQRLRDGIHQNGGFK